MQSKPPPILPREKVLARGVSNVDDAELLALLLGSGLAKKSVHQLARSLLRQASSLENLAKWPLARLLEVRGIGLAGATRLQASFEIHQRLARDPTIRYISSPASVFEAVRFLQTRNREHLVVLYLNARRQLLSQQTVAIGTLNTSLVQPRDIFETALKQPCFGIVLCHNHPSGDATPSQDDIAMTNQVVAAGELLGILVIDHIVVARANFSSFRELGLLKSKPP